VLWHNGRLPHPARSLAQAREQLRPVGFRWNPEGHLVDMTPPADERKKLYDRVQEILTAQ